MSRFGDKIQAFVDALAVAYPARIVGRDYIDLDLRKDSDLIKGVYSAISQSADNFSDVRNREDQTADLSFLLIAQIKLTPDDVNGSLVEEAELSMLDEVHDFLDTAPASLCGIDLRSFAQSQQLERPYGWLAMKLTWSEF